MDYPFLLYKMCSLPDELLNNWQIDTAKAETIDHPHFQDKTRNINAFRSTLNHPDLMNKTINYLHNFIDKKDYFWYEINVLSKDGFLAEHSDLAYSGYNVDKNKNPLETVMTHKLHIHISGQSELIFRRSKYENSKSFFPKPGDVFWYNNYVLHSTKNIGSDNRVAISLMYHDPKWGTKLKLIDSLKLDFSKRYQI